MMGKTAFGLSILAVALAFAAFLRSGDVRKAQREAADAAAVRDLVVAERLYRVSRRTAELAALYAPDAVIRTSWQSGGVASFVGKAPPDAGLSRPNVNRCNPPHVRCKGDRAFVEYPATTIRSVDVGGKDELAPAIPGDILEIDREKLLSFRQSYRNLAYVRSLDGGEVSDGEPGLDRPEEIARLYEEERVWLNGNCTQSPRLRPDIHNGDNERGV